MSQKEEELKNISFVAGGGEMGAIIRAFEWSKTSLGPLDTWPQSLKTTLGILLNSKFPMFLFWGPELLCFYNDAYRPSLGNDGKHPEALGRAGEEVWPEIWHIIKPLIDQALSGGEASWFEDQLLPIYRNGKIEDVYWSFSYSPVPEESGGIGGVMVVCNETTEHVKRKNEINQNFAFAIEAAELSIWDYDPFSNSFVPDKRYAEWFGLPAGQAIEKEKAFYIIAEEDRERVMEAYNKAINYSLQSTYDVEFTIRPQNKPERILRAKGKVWFNDQKKAIRFTGINQDVTQQVLARRKAEESEQQLRAIIESSPFPIGVYLGQEMRIQFANQAIIEGWGKGRDVIGKLFRDVLPELENQEVFHQLEQVYLTGKSFHARNQPLKLVIDGEPETFYFNYSFTPLYNVEGEVYGVINTAANVTDLTLAHQRIEKYAEVLKESEERFRLMADAVPQIIWITDSDGHVQFFNKQWTRYTGVPYKATTADAIAASFVHPDDGLFTMEAFTKARQEGSVFEAEHRILSSEGSYRWFLVRAEPYHDSKTGKIIRWFGTSVDIHDRKMAEEALRHSEEQFRLFVTTSSDTIYKMSPDWAQMLSLQGMDFLADTLSPSNNWMEGYIPDEDQPKVTASLEKAIRSKSRWELEHRVIKADGRVGWTFSRAIPILDKKGEITEWFGAASDTTERKMAEEALQESEERFRTVAEASGILIAHTDQEGSAIYFNQEWLKLSGRSIDDLINYGYVDLFHPDDTQRFLNAYRKAFRERHVLRHEFRLKNQENEYRWQLAVLSPRFSANGFFAGYISSCIDITDQKNAEKNLQLLSDRLSATNEKLRVANEDISKSRNELEKTISHLMRVNADLDNFIYTASHDLKTPINNIEGLMNILTRKMDQKGWQDQSIEQILQMINTSVLRFKRTVADLAEISKIERQIDVESEAVDLAEITSDVILDFSITVGLTGAVIEEKISGCPMITFSKKNLKSILYNLISNAIKYQDPGRKPHIIISCQPEGEYLVLSVQDNGLGLETKDDNKIFGMFQRQHSHVEGTGVGLYIVKKIVENAGGKITVESKIGKGSVFRVYFKL